MVKVEGVLIDPPAEWPLDGVDSGSLANLDVDELFPGWCRQLDLAEDELRNRLTRLAEGGSLTVDPDLRELIDSTRNHSPIRVAFLSSGPEEWVRTLEETLDLTDLRDLSFCYDNYRHGNRRTLLQFLMNRFIAGKGRTLLLGRTLADERLARREKTRFRSLEPAPGDARTPDHWGWSTDELETFMKTKQPEN